MSFVAVDEAACSAVHYALLMILPLISQPRWTAG
jgi:hypothetical protein